MKSGIKSYSSHFSAVKQVLCCICLTVLCVGWLSGQSSNSSEINRLDSLLQDARVSHYNNLAQSLATAKEAELLALRVSPYSPRYFRSKLFQAMALRQMGKAEEALEILVASQKMLPAQLMDSETNADILNELGLYHKTKGNYQEAITYFQKSLDIRKRLGSDSIAIAYTNLGQLHKLKGDMSKALEYYRMALEIDKKVRDLNGLAHGYNAIGGLYYLINPDTPIVLEYFQKGYYAAKQEGSKYNQAMLGTNIGYWLAEAGRNDSALYYLQEARRLDVELGDVPGIAFVDNELARFYYRQNDLVNSEKYLKTAEAALTGSDDLLLLSNVLGLRGMLEGKKGNYDYAVECLKKSLGIQLKNNMRTCLPMTYEELSKVYRQKGDFQNAMLFLEKYYLLNDTLKNQDVKLQIASISKQQEWQKQQNKYLETESELKSLRLDMFYSAAIGVCILVLTVGFLIYERHKSSQKTLESLSHKNEEVREVNELLIAQNAELEQYAYVVSHDLKEPLRNIASYANLFERRYSNILPDSDSREFLAFIRQNATRMSHMLDELATMGKLKVTEREEQIVDLGQVLEEAKALNQTALKLSNTHIQCEALPKIGNANQQQLVRVFQNLISNSIKYAQKGVTPEVKVSVQEKDDAWMICFEDNGIGLLKGQEKLIFKMFQQMDKNREGSGLGLSICEKIVKLHGGKIWATSKGVNKGTSVFFTIPK